MRKLFIIQARTGSKRLPNKSVTPFHKNKSLFEIIVQNIKSYYPDIQIVIATTLHESDDIIADICKRECIQFFRGHETDVLDRFINCAEYFSADIVIRVCGDNPLLQPQYFEDLIAVVESDGYDYCSYEWPDRTPVMLSHIGLFGEVMKLDFLKSIEKSTSDPFYREHVTNYVYSNRDKFNCKFIILPNHFWPYQSFRLTIDTPIDFKNAKFVYELAKEKDKLDKLEEVLSELLKNKGNLLHSMKQQIIQNEK